MEKKVLVVYASKYGATREIAQRISEWLTEAGLDTRFEPAGSVREIEPFDAVVLGSALYMFQWRREARHFLNRFKKDLASKSVWLFGSGPTEPGDPIELLEGKIMNSRMQTLVDSIHPVDVTVFGGVMNLDKLNFFERWVIKKMKAPTGDFRNWESIRSWTDTIVRTLKES